MSCTISEAQTRKCKDGAGGAFRFYFATHPEQTLDITYDGTSGKVLDVNDLASGSAVAVQLFDYTPAKNTGEFVEPQTVSDAGFGYEPTINMFFPKMEQETTDRLRTLAIGNVLSVVADRNQNYFLVGAIEGLTGDPGSTGSGKAVSDANGYTVILKGAEGLPAVQIDSDSVVIAADGTMTITSA